MKRLILLLVILFQFTLVSGQKILGENAERISYDTEWGDWTTIPGVSNLLFSSKLKWFDKTNNSYGWEIRWKAARTPVYFEFKIPNIIFKSYERTVQENGGWFNTTISSQNIASGGFGIDCTSKTTVLVQVRNICYELEGGIPKCSKTNAAPTNSNNSQIITQNSKTQNTEAQTQNVSQPFPKTKSNTHVNNVQQIVKAQAKEDAINQIGGVVSNTALSITNKGLANLTRQIEIESEVKKILSGRESQYPEAVKYFDVYLKEKRKRKIGSNIGLGFLVAGVAAAGVGTLSGGETDINEPLVYGGIGAAIVGLFKTITTISVSPKGVEALENAKRSLTLNTSSTGLGISLKF